MNQRYSDHVNSANSKFKSYPDFKTIILFRTDYIPSVVKYAIEGLAQYKMVNDTLSYVGRVGKYTKFGKNEVGGFLICSDKAYYFPNYLAKKGRAIGKDSIAQLTGWVIEDL